MRWAAAGFVALMVAWHLQAQLPAFAQPSVVMAPVENVQLHPGASTNVEMDFRVGSNFHINSNQPKSNLLIPTVLKLDAQQPLKVAALHYPPGEEQTFPFSPKEKLSVYSGDFAIDVVLKAAPNAAPGSYTVSGELRYQACDKSACYPPKTLPVQFEVTVK
jgi:hypothetical protein